MGPKLLFPILVICFFLLACGITNPAGEDRVQVEPDMELEITISTEDLKVSKMDGMRLVYVPAGDFLMGSDDEYGHPGDSPMHSIFLDAFWIDQTEVTNGQYQQCVAAGACEPPSDFSYFKREKYFGNDEFQDYPVAFVSWHQANDYCQWAGRRLPTEAEWEKAARGENGQEYPWGTEHPNYELLNFKGSAGQKNPLEGTTKVGSYPQGASPYGALDMAGNVSEWVADWYDISYYQTSPTDNPQGPPSGEQKVYRGGYWDTYDVVIHSSYRLGLSPNYSGLETGFRCAMGAED